MEEERIGRRQHDLVRLFSFLRAGCGAVMWCFPLLGDVGVLERCFLSGLAGRLGSCGGAPESADMCLFRFWQDLRVPFLYGVMRIWV